MEVSRDADKEVSREADKEVSRDADNGRSAEMLTTALRKPHMEQEEIKEMSTTEFRREAQRSTEEY